MEVLGTYDPTPKTDRYDTSGKLHKDIQLDLLRAKYWIGVGAQPSDRVWSLLSMVGPVPPHVLETACVGTRGRSRQADFRCAIQAGILEPKRRPAIMNKLAAQSGGIATKPVEESESSTAGEAGAEPTKS